MHWKRLLLENIGKHKRLDVEFTRGLIGIIGRNGSGKSTLLTSLYILLTNDWTRLFDKTKESYISDLGKGPSSITGWLEHQGKQVEIRRGISVGSYLLIDGKEVATAEKQINAAITELLCLNRKYLDNYVFIEQWAIRAPVVGTPESRAVVMQQLLDVAAADTLSKFLGEKAKDSRSLDNWLADVISQIASFKQKIPEIKTQGLAVVAEKKEAVRDILQPDEVRRLEGIVAKKETAEAINAQLEQTLLELPAATATLEAQTSFWKKSKEAASLAELEKPGVLADISSCNSKARQAAVRKVLMEAKEAFDRKARELESARSALAPPTWLPMEESLRAELKEVNERLAERLAETKSVKLKLDKSKELSNGKDVTCPVCGSVVKDPKAWRAKLKQEEKELADVVQTLRVKSVELTARIDACVAYTRQHQRLTDDLYKANQDADVARLKLEAAPKIDVAENQKELDRLDNRLHEIIKAMADVLLAAEKVSSAEHNVEHLTKQRDRLVKAYEGAPLQADVDRAKERLQAHYKASSAFAAADARGAELRKQLADVEKQLIEATQRQLLIEQQKAEIEPIEKSRQILKTLPRYLTGRYLRRLEQDPDKGINWCLERLDASFRVRVVEPLDFQILSDDFDPTKRHTATALSGGQQVALALAFRISAYLMQGSFGFLAFDEPTAGLDRQSLVEFRKTAARLAEMADAGGLQVLLITHEEGLAPAFSQVIGL